MTGPRSEEDKVTQAPIVVVLGGEEYEIKPLVIKDSREWRKKVVAALSDLPKYANVTTEEPEKFGDAINAMLSTMPDQVVDLFFSYAKELDQKALEAVATDYEVAKAFEEVVALAFPLASSLVETMVKLSQ